MHTQYTQTNGQVFMKVSNLLMIVAGVSASFILHARCLVLRV